MTRSLWASSQGLAVWACAAGQGYSQRKPPSCASDFPAPALLSCQSRWWLPTQPLSAPPAHLEHGLE